MERIEPSRCCPPTAPTRLASTRVPGQVPNEYVGYYSVDRVMGGPSRRPDEGDADFVVSRSSGPPL